MDYLLPCKSDNEFLSEWAGLQMGGEGWHGINVGVNLAACHKITAQKFKGGLGSMVEKMRDEMLQKRVFHNFQLWREEYNSALILKNLKSFLKYLLLVSLSSSNTIHPCSKTA